MYTFVRHFGALVGFEVPEGDKVWDVYLILKKILDFITAPSVQKGTSTLLRTLIKEHQCMIIDTLERNQKPKNHLGIQLPVDESGLPVSMWCMYFGAQHRKDKFTTSVSTSTVNVLETISTKSQLKFASMLYSQSFSPPMKARSSKECSLKNLLINFEGIGGDRNRTHELRSINIVNSVRKHGTLYKTSMILSVTESGNEPVFGRLRYIYLRQSEPIFIYEQLNSVFRDYYCAYEVLSSEKELEVISHEKLYSHKQ
ncbi:hypothetical protein QAD02_001737 [Eretmocerus hayati]|uniref:Uncharacterized protein n=1 Tax=Eretmocerus hayati TaxID=131215 RepID=A0ACC2NH12_9HYME|nr:hypothetical protein QAD02_001737 [Eretmocerus hayati]